MDATEQPIPINGEVDTQPSKLREMGLSGLHIWPDDGFGVDKADDALYHCQSGVILRLKPVSSVLIRTRVRSIPVPLVPMYHNPTTEREEENWTAPEYIAALTKYDQDVAEVNIGTLFLLGTEVVSVPPSVATWESTAWSTPLTDREIWGDLAMAVPDSGQKRYIFWMTYIALRDVEAAEVSTQIRILGGAIPEEAVKEAMDSFRAGDRRDATVGVDTPNRQQRRTKRR